MSCLHSMKVAVRRTGLSSHLIRVWERRYRAVTPARSRSNRRLYTDSEIARLALLQEATREGHSIGQIAELTNEELQALVDQARHGNGSSKPARAGRMLVPADCVAEAWAAIKRLDGQALEGVLARAAAAVGPLGLLQHLLAPLIRQVGEAWEEGSLKMAHEHLATAVIRSFLGGLMRPHGLPASAPRLLVTTPTGQWHELGGLLAAAAATDQGWRVAYLGPSLPAEAIAEAAREHRARAVALSLVYPPNDPCLDRELRRLRQLLPDEVNVLVGGRAAGAYRGLLEQIGALQIEDLDQFRAALSDLGKTPVPG